MARHGPGRRPVSVGVALVALLLPNSLSAASLAPALIERLTEDAAVPPLPPEDAEENLNRLAGPDYADGVSAMAGPNRPDARTLSNTLSQPQNRRSDTAPLSNLGVAYFQLIASHEIAHTRTNPAEPAPIPLKPGDPLHDPTLPPGVPQAIPFDRSQHDPATGTGPDNPRQQVDHITTTFDASTVYGSNSTREAKLRQPGSAKLKVGPDGGLPVDPDTGRPIAGDARADENPNLQSLHALFVREHNRLVDEIEAGCKPGCTDDQVYAGAKVLVSRMQHKIFYDELVPAFLGTDDMRSLLPEPSMADALPADMFQAFPAAAGRLGHTQVPDTIETGAPGGPVQSVSLAECFFNANCLGDATEAEKLFGAAQQAAEPIDTVVADSLRNAQLTGPGANFVIDLFATNIQRGRDHGLPSYGAMRAALGFATAPLESLLPQAVLDAYGASARTDGVDLLVGLFSEHRPPDDYLGETGKALWALQMEAIRDQVLGFDGADLAAFGASAAESEALLAAWLEEVSMASLLSGDTGYARDVWGTSPFLAEGHTTAPVPLPPAAAMLLVGVGALRLARRG